VWLKWLSCCFAGSKPWVQTSDPPTKKIYFYRYIYKMYICLSKIKNEKNRCWSGSSSKECLLSKHEVTWATPSVQQMVLYL
jgi:hypothetical protein